MKYLIGAAVLLALQLTTILSAQEFYVTLSPDEKSVQYNGNTLELNRVINFTRLVKLGRGK